MNKSDYRNIHPILHKLQAGQLDGITPTSPICI
jgi:hypothetical protein